MSRVSIEFVGEDPCILADVTDNTEAERIMVLKAVEKIRYDPNGVCLLIEESTIWHPPAKEDKRMIAICFDGVIFYPEETIKKVDPLQAFAEKDTEGNESGGKDAETTDQ